MQRLKRKTEWREENTKYAEKYFMILVHLHIRCVRKVFLPKLLFGKRGVKISGVTVVRQYCSVEPI